MTITEQQFYDMLNVDEHMNFLYSVFFMGKIFLVKYGNAY